MKQLRNTRQRQLVLDAVCARKDHPTADEIYADVRAVDQKISRGTVYRNLGILSKCGEILHVKVPAADRYDCRLDMHYHMICVKCGSVSDAVLPYHGELDRQLTMDTGYQVIRHRIVFEGVCPSCQACSEE